MTNLAGDPVDLLARALEQVGAVLASVREDQQELPTPCRSWTVAGLGDHLVHDLSQFFKTATGDRPDWSEPVPAVSGDRAAAFRAGASELIAAWRKAGDLTGTITMPGMGELPARFPVDQQTAEFAVHAWDMARATGKSTDLDPAVGQASLDWIRGALQPAFRGAEADGRAFGPEVPVPADAPLYDRLAGLAGRDPSRT
ncbi:TIGR03086 family metal-binding protein [Solwaraspora sp. WMMD1047]|uniref:TIGR03086 family metal-binding protein n=1 Tax=Solwaraspora sp. WMMD1047 TaxID=3016102 RepID=UPI002417476E|nr:TIGR03086 family metal-binding protein [Solwaraspora sp. WMMD1047]MDG4831107.1 TIGR03086 family metal-binding protein [Solwaraspora sp. WMMD1047]